MILLHRLVATMLDVAGRDIRYGLRQLRRNPAFSAVAIVTLALSIGGITAIFSAVDTILVRPLPYADADQLLMVWDDMGRADVGAVHPRPRHLRHQRD